MIAELLNRITTVDTNIGTPASDDLTTLIEALAATLANVTQSEMDTLITNCDAPISGIGGGAMKAVKLTSGTSWTHPSDLNAEKFVRIIVVAAGASGEKDSAGGGGYGGGGGEVIRDAPLFLTGSTTTYAIGTGGVAKTSDGAGNNGGDTTFDALTAEGGQGQLGGGFLAGGTSSDANELGYRLSGAAGGSGNLASNEGGNALSAGGAGGGTSNAGGGGASWGVGGDYNADPGIDGGGGGGGESNDSGAGGDGFVIVTYVSA